MHDERRSGLETLVEVGRNDRLDSPVVLEEGILMLLRVFVVVVMLNRMPRTSPSSLKVTDRKFATDDPEGGHFINIYEKIIFTQTFGPTQ